MNKREKLVFGIVAALAMTSGGIAYGQSVNNVSSDQVIYACVTGVNGNIVRVSNTRKTCPRGTTPIQWNAAGPRGEQGIPGSAVAKGDKGEKGDTGLQGPQGPKGDSSSSTVSQTFLVSPGGDKYPFISTPYGTLVNIDGALWAWDGGKPVPTNYNFFPGTFYQSANCTGDPYTLYKKDNMPPANNVAVTFNPPDEFGVSTLNSYLTRVVGTQTVSQFASYKINGSGACNPYDKLHYKNALTAFADQLRIAKQRIPTVVQLNPERFMVGWNFSDCTVYIKIFANSRWQDYETFNSTNCALQGDRGLDLFVNTYTNQDELDMSSRFGIQNEGYFFRNQSWYGYNGLNSANQMTAAESIDSAIGVIDSFEYFDRWNALRYVSRVNPPTVSFADNWSVEIN